MDFKTFNAATNLLFIMSKGLTNDSCKQIWSHVNQDAAGFHHMYSKYTNLYNEDIVLLWSRLDNEGSKESLYNHFSAQTKLQFDQFCEAMKLILAIPQYLNPVECEKIWPLTDPICDPEDRRDIYYQYNTRCKCNALRFWRRLDSGRKQRLYKWCCVKNGGT